MPGTMVKAVSHHVRKMIEVTGLWDEVVTSGLLRQMPLIGI